MPGAPDDSTPTTLDRRVALFSASATPEISPPPPIGTIAHFHLGPILVDLQAERSLSGNQLLIVKGMNVGVAALFRRLSSPSRSPRPRWCREARPRRHSARVAATFDGVTFSAMDHHRLDAVVRRCERDALGMVAGRRADDPASLLGVRQVSELVHRSADLVRAAALEHLAFRRSSKPVCSLSSLEVSSGVRYTFSPMRARAFSKSGRVSGSMPASIAGRPIASGRRLDWSEMTCRSGSRERRRDLALLGGEGKSLEPLALHRTPDAAARVMVDCCFEGLDAAVVHVGCGHGNVAEGRRESGPYRKPCACDRSAPDRWADMHPAR